MIHRTIVQPGIRTKAGCRGFRATGITCYLESRKTVGKSQQMTILLRELDVFTTI